MRISSDVYSAKLITQNPSKEAAVSVNRMEDQRDVAELSAHAQDYRDIKKALALTPDIRADKVTALQEQINTGAYKVSSYEVASSICVHNLKS
jgi:negative regulator of flagellin synthesis FlgM